MGGEQWGNHTKAFPLKNHHTRILGSDAVAFQSHLFAAARRSFSQLHGGVRGSESFPKRLATWELGELSSIIHSRISISNKM